MSALLEKDIDDLVGLRKHSASFVVYVSFVGPDSVPTLLVERFPV